MSDFCAESDFCTDFRRGKSKELEKAANEIERLRAELSEKDKRIAELTRDLHVAEEELYYPDKHGCVVITEADIDKAWRIAQRADLDVQRWLAMAFAEVGIVACSECGGSGDKIDRSEEPGFVEDDCPVCHRNGVSHGWVWQPKGITHRLEGHATISLGGTNDTDT